MPRPDAGGGMNFEDGDEVLLTCDGRTVPAKLIMISKNQVAALLSFEAIVAGHVGAMPVTRHDAKLGTYRSIIDGTQITFQKKPQ